jgi:hypothetical protein
MQPWIIKKIKEKAAESSRNKSLQPRLPVNEPRPPVPTKTQDGPERGIVSVDFEL